jgi:sulfatase maturation enzyme AslB (radical SAM superfamily)
MNGEPEAVRDTVCVLPWTHIASTVDGVWGRCCFDSTNDYDHYYQQETEPEFILEPDAIGCSPLSRYAGANPDRTMGILEAFNSPNMRRTRMEMLAGEKPAACDYCFKQESLGVGSHRTHMNGLYNEKVDLPGLLAATAPDGTLDRFPINLDLRFGNTCNLSCIMCSFPVSSKLGAGRSPVWTTANIDPYREDDELWSTLREHAHEIRYLYIAGGEPFMQPGHLRLLELLTETGAAGEIEIHYNSNLTVLPSTLWQQLRQFKHASIAASCDGVGEVFERIRVGARWETFVANLRTTREHVEVWLDVTVQRDNIADLRQLYRFARAEGVRMRTENILQYPEEFSVRSLPREERERHAADVAALVTECADGDPLIPELENVREYLLS